MMIRGEIRIPKDNTKSKILKHLSGEDMTALDLAEKLDINESAVRRHLDNLETQDMITHEFKKVERGRPKKFFSLTEKGNRSFPREPEILLDLLIKNVREEFGEEKLDEFSDKVIEDLRDYFPEVETDEELESKIQKTVQSFDDLGFYCSYSESNGVYSIKYKNCAFGKISEEQGSWLCKVHKKLLKDLFGDVNLDQESSMSRGDKICLQRISE